jgi:hypothetical protein
VPRLPLLARLPTNFGRGQGRDRQVVGQAKALVLPRRSPAERPRAWLARCRRLAKDWEDLTRRGARYASPSSASMGKYNAILRNVSDTRLTRLIEEYFSHRKVSRSAKFTRHVLISGQLIVHCICQVDREPGLLLMWLRIVLLRIIQNAI